MIYRVLADLVVVLHLAFVAFVVLGGLLVLRRPRVAWVHIPVAVYGALIEFVGWTCPLTPLEVRLRVMGGEEGYAGASWSTTWCPSCTPRTLPGHTRWSWGSWWWL